MGNDDERQAVAAELDRAWGKYRDGDEIARADRDEGEKE